MKKKFRKNGYEYEEVCSNEGGKLFVQKYRGKFVAYEVIKQKKTEKSSLPANIKFHYPGNEAFGYSAWSYKQLKPAMEKLYQLRNLFFENIMYK